MTHTLAVGDWWAAPLPPLGGGAATAKHSTGRHAPSPLRYHALARPAARLEVLQHCGHALGLTAKDGLAGSYQKRDHSGRATDSKGGRAGLPGAGLLRSLTGAPPLLPRGGTVRIQLPTAPRHRTGAGLKRLQQLPGHAGGGASAGAALRSPFSLCLSGQRTVHTCDQSATTQQNATKGWWLQWPAALRSSLLVRQLHTHHRGLPERVAPSSPASSRLLLEFVGIGPAVLALLGFAGVGPAVVAVSLDSLLGELGSALRRLGACRQRIELEAMMTNHWDQ